MKSGDSINIKATVLRVDGVRVDAQTANGQLIQTSIENVMQDEKKQPEAKEKEKPKPAEKKSVPLSEHKAILNSPENKSR